MSETLRGILPSGIALGVMAAVALGLAVTRDFAEPGSRRGRGAVPAAVTAVLVQAAHFSEELATGLHQRLPELLGLPAMPVRLFVLFNLGWLAIWSVSVIGLAAGRRLALFPLWFLGIGCAVNGVAHPALALLSRGYFPGLATSLASGVAGVWLLVRLSSVTSSRRVSAAA